MPIVDFLQTKRSKEDLQIALDVLHEFKSGESWDEYLGVMFSAWVKLEQLEEYLEHLVNGAPLQDDTLEELKRRR